MDRVDGVTRECFNAIIQLRQLDDASLPPAEAVHRRMRGFVDALMGRARQVGLSREDADDVAYAIVALADEVATSKDALRPVWATQPLQLLYFQENVAGEGFFTRLEGIRRDPRRREVLRVYQLALLFGFQGRYRVRGGELELLGLTEELERELARGREVDVETLSPHGERTDEGLARGATSRRIAWIGVGALAASVLIAIVLRIWVGASTSGVVERIAAANLP